MMEIIGIIADVATAITMVIALFTLLASVKKYKTEKLHDKRKNTLDAYHNLQNEVFDKMFPKYSKDKIQQISKHYRSKNEEYRELSTYLAKIEHFCVGVVYEIYDWEIVYELSHGFFDGKVRDAIKPLMDRKISFSEHDPFENTRKVYMLMDQETQERLKGTKRQEEGERENDSSEM